MNRAHLEAVLVGVALPAKKRELVEYARRQRPDGPEAAALIEARVPDDTYMTIQDVGEAVEPVQPSTFDEPAPSKVPREEAGTPPGKDAYLGDEVEPLNVIDARRNA